MFHYFSLNLCIHAKAAEAAQSAYYDPNRPQCAYVPPPEYYRYAMLEHRYCCKCLQQYQHVLMY
ncbi:hypothetical protein X777_14550 [Ooceraea biroi]|uniref:Secreted protein n=1 Tax=Ooceraea biroi TaxID=2015173 RepID=A0A026WZF2_OOCBI|nr:hypothetical protein X777_14550 [Ooceraea biroi]